MGDAIMDFVNELGYTEVTHFVSRMAVNNLSRSLLSIIWEELIIYTKDKHLRFISLKKISDLNAPYFNAYLEKVAKHDRKVAAEKGGKKKPATAKQLKSKRVKEKSSKPAPAPKTKVTQAKPAKPSHVKHSKLGKVLKTRKGKSSLLLIAKDEPTQPEPEPEPKNQGEMDEFDVERAIQMSLESFQAHSQAHVGSVAIREHVVEATQPLPVVEAKGKAISIEEQAVQSLLALHTQKRRCTTDQFIFQRGRHQLLKRYQLDPLRAYADMTYNGGDTEILQFGEEQGEDVDDQVNLEEKTTELDQGQAGSDIGKTPESRPLPEQEFMDVDQSEPDPKEICVALAGLNPEPTHDDFMANVYLNNLDDAYTIGDQFLNDKSSKDDSGKLNVETEVVCMVTVPIYQASSSAPPLSTPVIDLFLPKPKLGSRVFSLELRDLPHKINQTVNEVVKEAVHIAFQASLRDRFREPPKADMKEILHQRMFESDSYESLPEHIALYEALEASMERVNRDEFFAKKDNSQAEVKAAGTTDVTRLVTKHEYSLTWSWKQFKLSPDLGSHTPPLPPNSDPSKKSRRDSDALGSSQPPVPQSSAWKTSNTREAPSSSSKQQSGPYSKQPDEDVPMPDTALMSDSEDIDSAYLSKIKSKLELFKPILKEDRPATLEPD
nr:hypothetical protein [Tanacetum cinerariifolium]